MLMEIPELTEYFSKTSTTAAVAPPQQESTYAKPGFDLSHELGK